MDRLTNINQTTLEALRADLQSSYADYEKPCPASALKIDDDIEWYGVMYLRVLWGTDGPDFLMGYAPDVGDFALNIDGHYVTDRAPADPQETPMPVWPEALAMMAAASPDAAAAAGGGKAQPKKKDDKAAVRHLLEQLPPDAQKKVRALFKAKRPDLLDSP